MKGLLLRALLLSIFWYGVEGEFISLPPPPPDFSTRVEVVDTELRRDPWRRYDNVTELLKVVRSVKPGGKIDASFVDQLQKNYKYCQFLVPDGPHQRWYTPATCVKESDCEVVSPFSLTEWGNKTCRSVAQGMVEKKEITLEEANSFTCCPLNGTKDWRKELESSNVSASGIQRYLEYKEIPPTLIQDNVSYVYISSWSYDTHLRNVTTPPTDKEQLEKFYTNTGTGYEDYINGTVCGFVKWDNLEVNFKDRARYSIHPYFCVEPSECGKGQITNRFIPKTNPLWHQFCQGRFRPQSNPNADVSGEPKYIFPSDPNNKKTVCCHVHDMYIRGLTGGYIATPQIPTFFNYAVGMRSTYKCEEYTKRVCDYDGIGANMCVEGNSNPPTWAENPHMASLGVVVPKIMYFHCGGTLISLRFILSAETCDTYWGYKANVVLLGSYATEHHDPRKIQIYLIVDILKTQGSPPAFKSLSGKDNEEYTFDEIDLALYKLDRDVTYTRYARPACLWHGHHEWPSNPQFLAWSSPDSYRSSYLRTLSDLRFTKWCGSKEFNHDEKQFPYHGKFGAPHPWHVCYLDHPDTGVGGKYTLNPCNVDQGGPLQEKLSSPYCANLLLGVLSTRAYCRPDQITPSAFINVTHFIGAIEDAVWGNYIFQDIHAEDLQKPSCGDTKDLFFFTKCENGDECPE